MKKKVKTKDIVINIISKNDDIFVNNYTVTSSRNNFEKDGIVLVSMVFGMYKLVLL